MTCDCCKLERCIKTAKKDIKSLESGLSALDRKVRGQKRTVYRYAPPNEPGLRTRWWNDTAGPHLDPLEWSGPADYNGFPLPSANPPDFDVVNNTTSISDSSSGAGAARYGIIDGWILLPDNATHLRDNNANTGELGMVLLGDCCGGVLSEAPGGNHGASTNGADRTLMDATSVSGGWTYIYNPQSDSGAFQGLDLEYSVSGDVGPWINVATKQPTMPTVDELEIGVCDPIPEGYQTKPLKEFCQPKYVSTGTTLSQSNAIPIADNEDDASIRTGSSGTSADVSRADHNHPIVRQSNPGTPTPTLSGPATETLSQFRRFRSTEEWVRFSWRMRFTTDVANGWKIYTIPQIGGFQFPILHCHGVYRQTGGEDSTDIVNPTMDGNGVDWADIGRLYYGQFTGKDTSETWWPNVQATYVRA